MGIVAKGQLLRKGWGYFV